MKHTTVSLQELRDMETELLKRLEFANKVQGNTKALERELSIVRLAQEAVLSRIGAKRI